MTDTVENGGGASRSTDPASGSSAATDVSLREHLEMRIGYERQVVNLYHDLHDQALRLQAAEYERRLDDLNHSAQRIEANNARNVSDDTWKEFTKAYKEDNERTDHRFDVVEKFQNKLLGALALAAIFIPLLTGIAVYLLTRHAIPTGK